MDEITEGELVTIDNPPASEQAGTVADAGAPGVGMAGDEPAGEQAQAENEGESARRITLDSPFQSEPIRKIPGGYGGTLTPWHKGDPRASEAGKLGAEIKRNKREMAEAAVLLGVERGVSSVSDRPVEGLPDAIAAIAEQQSILAYSGERGSTQAARFVFEAGGLMSSDRRGDSSSGESGIKLEIGGPVAENIASILAEMMGRK